MSFRSGQKVVIEFEDKSYGEGTIIDHHSTTLLQGTVYNVKLDGYGVIRQINEARLFPKAE